MKNIIIFSLLLLSLFSCSLENKKPEFKRIENLKINNFTVNNVEVEADAIIYNPNGISVFLNSTELDVFANDIKVTHISQTKNTEITKKSEFKIPLQANFKMVDLIKDETSIINLISSSINTYSEKTIMIRYSGYSIFKIAGIEFKVPIEYENEVDITK